MDVEEYRDRLTEERDQLNRELGNIMDTAEPNTDAGQITAADANIMSEVVDVEVEVKDLKTRQLERVNAALQAIEDGTYGACIVCGKPIDPRRLAAEPAALTCMDHVPAEEANFAAPTL